jgi:hypothetical protein
LLWPVLFSLVLARLSPRRAALGLLGACVASAAWMHLLYNPGEDPSRVYYGSDTRAFGLLLGASLAFARPWLVRAAQPRLDTALALMALLTLGHAFAGLDELMPFVYPNGLLCVGVATCTLIASIVRAPEGPLTRLLATPLLVALGKRSYSLYLWHWPVVAITRPGVDVALDGGALLALRLGLTALLAEASYRLVETPLRRGDWFSFPKWQWNPTRLRPYAAALTTAVLMTFSAGALISAQEPPAVDLTLPGPSAAALRALALPASGPLLATSASALSGAVKLPHVLAIGDSVMLGARKFLRSELAEVEVDAEVGRTPLLTLSLLKKRKAAGTLGDVVIIHLGNNGPFQHEQFDRWWRSWPMCHRSRSSRPRCRAAWRVQQSHHTRGRAAPPAHGVDRLVRGQPGSRQVVQRRRPTPA